MEFLNRRAKNLRDLLVRARLPTNRDQARGGAGGQPPPPPPNTPVLDQGAVTAPDLTELAQFPVT